MTTKHSLSLVNLFVVVAKVLLASLALLYLADYFGLPLFREAGGHIA